MTLPERVVCFLQENKGNYWCVDCLCRELNSRSRACMNTIRATLALCRGYTASQNKCPACGTVFALRDFEIQCPKCHAEVTEPFSGNELEVAFIELEEP